MKPVTLTAAWSSKLPHVTSLSLSLYTRVSLYIANVAPGLAKLCSQQQVNKNYHGKEITPTA